MKVISIVMACYNEEENIEVAYNQVKELLGGYKDYNYEHIFIDNASTDRTFDILKEIALKDKKVKLIRNSRNFGHIRSPFYGILQANGEAVVILASDLQDPPYLIKEFIKKWEEGFKIVVGVKKESHEPFIMGTIRKVYYRFISKIANLKLIKNFTGFGLYDRTIVEHLRKIEDPYPYFRGLISEIGFDVVEVPYVQPSRARGISKNNFYTLYDMAMLGITSFSKIPLRLATMLGFALALISFLLSFVYLILKLIFWQQFTLGTAPLLIGIFFFSSVQLFFIGVLGEYIASIHTIVLKRPLVIEKERINF